MCDCECESVCVCQRACRLASRRVDGKKRSDNYVPSVKDQHSDKKGTASVAPWESPGLL